MLDQFINEIIDAILHFCKYFHLSQNVSHVDLFKQMSAEKHLFKGELTKGMGIIASYVSIVW